MLTNPPYALAAPDFRFRALASLCGRAALGGSRELLIAILLAARLVDGALGPYPLTPAVRRARAIAARTWLSSIAMPSAARSILARLIDVTGGDDRAAIEEAWTSVLTMIAPSLDGTSRMELRRLIAAAPGGGAAGATAAR